MDSMDGMNMTDSSNTTSTDSSSMMMMKTYLHFTPGDTLIFSTIVPTSAGAIFGTCLVLFFISVADRYLRAVVRGLERGFAQRTQRLASTYYFAETTGDSPALPSKSPVSDGETHPAPSAPTKFILSHELSRGVTAGLQSTLHYFLMLVVMTFNASFIISVIMGVVVGEVAFGRLNR
ncbi:Ctr copper transporter [Mycena rosella]|uniref:Copper transport protein n=1 Tax=Mycena rosella TaxID=1033263 RepID=A0AAD7GF09_MYCRO|nr:Ctr copper transporter [Mycena rosella]